VERRALHKEWTESSRFHHPAQGGPASPFGWIDSDNDALRTCYTHLFKAILQCLCHRFGFGFAGQGCQIGSQFFVSWFRMFKAMFHYG
jgi:hypothetical protein